MFACQEPCCTAGSNAPRTASVTGRPSGPATTSGRSATSTGWSNAFARHLAARGVTAGRPGRGDDGQPGRVPRRRPRRSASSARRPCCSARRGRRPRSTTPSSSPGPSTPSPTAIGVALLVDRLGRRWRHRPRRSGDGRRRRRPRPATASRRPRRTRPTTPVLVFSSGTTGLPEGGAPHPPLDRPAPRPTGCAALGSRPRRPLPGGHPAVAHPRPAQPARRRRGRGDRAPAPPVRPRRGAAPRSSPTG